MIRPVIVNAELMFDLFVRRDGLRFLERAAETAAGHSLQLPLGLNALHVATSPEMTEAILVRAAGVFPKAPGRFGYIDKLTVHDGLLRRLLQFPFDDQFWVRERALVNRVFRHSLMEGYGAEISRRVEKYVETRREQGVVINALQDMSRLSFASLSNNLLHFEGDDDAEAIFEAFNLLSRFITRRALSPFSLPAALPTKAVQSVRASCACIARFLDSAAAETAKAPPPLLADAEGRPRALDDNWRYQIASLLIAGYETTAVALVWTLRLIADHPEVQQSLAEEVVRVCGDALPTVADLGALDGVGRVANEGLRLFPPLWVLGLRLATQDLELHGARIRRGDLMLVSPWINHHNGAVFHNPKQFDPDRWQARQTGLDRYAFIPFGVGAHACIGRLYAQMAMHITLATLLQAFRIERNQDAGSQRASAKITLRPPESLLVLRPRRRDEGV
jgi:cytochrome P450